MPGAQTQAATAGAGGEKTGRLRWSNTQFHALMDFVINTPNHRGWEEGVLSAADKKALQEACAVEITKLSTDKQKIWTAVNVDTKWRELKAQYIELKAKLGAQWRRPPDCNFLTRVRPQARAELRHPLTSPSGGIR